MPDGTIFFEEWLDLFAYLTSDLLDLLSLMPDLREDLPDFSAGFADLLSDFSDFLADFDGSFALSSNLFDFFSFSEEEDSCTLLAGAGFGCYNLGFSSSLPELLSIFPSF